MPRVYRLSSPNEGTHRLLTEFDAPPAGKRFSIVTITRTGTFRDPRYGEFDITRDMLLSTVRNHQPGMGAAAEIEELSVEGDCLRHCGSVGSATSVPSTTMILLTTNRTRST